MKIFFYLLTIFILSASFCYADQAPTTDRTIEYVLNRVWDSSTNTLRATITGDATLSSLTVSGTPSRITWSDNSYIGVDSSTFTFNAAGAWDWTDSNIIWLRDTDDIETAITNSVSGDTIVLASGTYTVTSAIDISSLIHIVGMGQKATVINCTNTNDNCIKFTAGAGSSIRNLGITMTGITGTGTNSAILVDRTASTVNSNYFFENIDITVTGNGTSGGIRGINLLDSGATIKNIKIFVTEAASSGTPSDYGIQINSASTAEAPITLNIHDSDIQTDSTVGSTGNNYALFATDSGTSSTITINTYNCNFAGNDTANSAASRGVVANGDGTTLTLYGGGNYVTGVDNSVFQSTSAVLNVNGGVISGSPSGTITYLANVGANFYIYKPYTVATLPSSSVSGRMVMISDGNSTTDCTTGGGSTYNVCISNGSAWIDA